MRFVLAGGGTAGHVNPLLATADKLADEGHQLAVLGTKEGLESRLVPERGHQLLIIPNCHFQESSRRLQLRFPFASCPQL